MRSSTKRRAQLSACFANIVFLIHAPAAGAGQFPSDGQPLDQLVVIANKDERSIRNVAAEVTVLTGSDLKANFAASFADTFRYVPGIDYQGAGTRFGAEGVSIRGIGGNRVVLKLDGVPLPDQFDIGNFSNATRDFLETGLVQKIEVMRGPSSALYGSSAIGGVVSISSSNPEDLITAGAYGGGATIAYREADRSWNGQVLMAADSGSLGLVAGATWRDGEDADSAAEENNLDQRAQHRRSAIIKLVGENDWRHRWQIMALHQDSDVQSDLKSMLGSGRFRSTTRLTGDDNNVLDILSANYSLEPAFEVVDKVTVSGFFELADLRQETLDERTAATRPVRIDRLFSYKQRIRGLELNLQKAVNIGSAVNQIGFGADWLEHDTDEMRDGLETGIDDGVVSSLILGEQFPLRDFPVSNTRESGVYIEDVMSVGPWTVIAALRVDNYALSPQSDAIYIADNPTSDVVAISESELSPKLGVVYQLSASTDVYVQYAHGFRAPPFEDANIGLDIPRFNIRAIPNPDLRSESVDGLDVGFRWQGVESGIRLSLFRNRYEDFIETKVRLGADPVTGTILFQSQNLNNAEIDGIEASWWANLSGQLSGFGLEASAHVSRGINHDNGEAINSVGPGQAVLGANWTSRNGSRTLRLIATLTRKWSELDETNADLFNPPGHAVLDLFYSQRLTDRITINAGLFNMADRRYWNWSDVGGFADGDPTLASIAQPGRSVALGVNLNW